MFYSLRYSLVWRESLGMFRDMAISEEWETRDNLVVPAVKDLTSKVVFYNCVLERIA